MTYKVEMCNMKTETDTDILKIQPKGMATFKKNNGDICSDLCAHIATKRVNIRGREKNKKCDLTRL